MTSEEIIAAYNGGDEEVKRHLATIGGRGLAEHGTRSRYTTGHCRCEDCKRANRVYVKAWRERTGWKRPRK